MLKQYFGEAKMADRFSIVIDMPGTTTTTTTQLSRSSTTRHSKDKGKDRSRDKACLLLVRGTVEQPGFVQATVTLELDTDCRGDKVEIVFKASVGTRVPTHSVLGHIKTTLSEQIMQKKCWLLPVAMVKPGVIAAGKYTRQVFTVIEPTWPSSSSSIYNPLTSASNNDNQSIANNTTHTIFQSKEVNITTHDDGGFVQYSFQAQITRVGLLNISHPIAAAAQEFLVLNYSSFLTSGLPPSLRLAHTITVISSKKGIPLQVAIPFNTVVFGQTVPVTVGVDSFLDTSVFAGREVVILKARFGIHEIRQMRSLNNIVDKKVVMETFEIQVPGTSGGSWPQSRNGWRRTVDVQIPQSYFETVMDSAATPQQTSINSGTPRLLTSLKSKYYDVEHQLVVVLKVRTSGEKDKHAETIDLRLDLKIVHPLPDDMASAAEYQSIAAFLFERLSVVH